MKGITIAPVRIDEALGKLTYKIFIMLPYMGCIV